MICLITHWFSLTYLQKCEQDTYIYNYVCLLVKKYFDWINLVIRIVLEKLYVFKKNTMMYR